MSASNQKSKHVFNVSIGVELPPETVNRIAHAIQKSVLSELVSAEIKPSMAVNFVVEQPKSGEDWGKYWPWPILGLIIDPILDPLRKSNE